MKLNYTNIYYKAVYLINKLDKLLLYYYMNIKTFSLFYNYILLISIELLTELFYIRLNSILRRKLIKRHS
jgi:hypothetical protein